MRHYILILSCLIRIPQKNTLNHQFSPSWLLIWHMVILINWVLDITCIRNTAQTDATPSMSPWSWRKQHILHFPNLMDILYIYHIIYHFFVSLCPKDRGIRLPNVHCIVFWFYSLIYYLKQNQTCDSRY